jgi:LuxR family maltose regulon positive regulatory protein
VRLAALALRSGDDAADGSGAGACSSGESPQLQQYFVEEVLLADQTAGTVTACCSTSILDRFCAPLCDAVLWEGRPAGVKFGQSGVAAGGGPRARCSASAIDDGRHWYRYRRLFREFLQRQLSLRCTPADIAELHHRAAAWLATQGLLEEAIPHAPPLTVGRRPGNCWHGIAIFFSTASSAGVSTAVCGCCRPILSRAIPNCWC